MKEFIVERSKPPVIDETKIIAIVQPLLEKADKKINHISQ